MPQDFPDMRSLLDLASRLDLKIIDGETEEELRYRLFEAVLEKEGDTTKASEVLTGKAWDKFNKKERDLSLIIHIAHTKHKKEKLQMIGDTYYAMSWNELEDILLGKKFEKVYSYDFKGGHSNEEFAIWIERNKALFLRAESYGRDREVGVNNVNLFYELSLPIDIEETDEDLWVKIRGVTEGSSHGSAGKGTKTICVMRDAREKLLEHLDKLEESLEEGILKTNNPWKYFDRHLLRLVNYSEKDAKDYDYKKITLKRVRELPEEVQEMIGFNPRHNNNI